RVIQPLSRAESPQPVRGRLPEPCATDDLRVAGARAMIRNRSFILGLDALRREPWRGLRAGRQVERLIDVEYIDAQPAHGKIVDVKHVETRPSDRKPADRHIADCECTHRSRADRCRTKRQRTDCDARSRYFGSSHPHAHVDPRNSKRVRTTARACGDGTLGWGGM